MTAEEIKEQIDRNMENLQQECTPSEIAQLAAIYGSYISAMGLADHLCQYLDGQKPIIPEGNQ